jgi:hypothetical protein
MAKMSNALLVISEDFELLVGKLSGLLQLCSNDPYALERLRTAQDKARRAAEVARNGLATD